MILSFIWSKLNEDERPGLVFGFVAGPAFGLAFGLVAGLVAGLASSLLSGLVFGFVAGLAFGLAFGLVAGLVAGLAFGISAGIGAEWYLLVGAILVLTELFYWFDKKKPNKKISVFWFTALRKLEAAFESTLLTVNFFVWKKQLGLTDWNLVKIFFMKAGQIIGIVVLCAAIIAGYVYVNSLKYRKVK